MNRWLFKLSSSACLIVCLTLSATLVRAEDVESDAEHHLLGSWGGVRPALAAHGLTIESIVTLDTIGNLSGGAKRGTVFLGNYDLTATLDTDKAIGLPGGTLFVYLLGNFGEAPSALVGDTQVSDNIEAYETFKLYEAWYDQLLFDDTLSILVGLHDYNSEFYSLEYASGLLNSSFGVGPDVAQVGPSIFSTTSLAARVKTKILERGYLMGALYDGVPGDPNNPRGTHIDLSSDDGLFYAAELGMLGEAGRDYYKVGLGFWYQTTDFEDFSGAEHSNNHGFYLIGERALYSEDGAGQGLGGFVQIGLPRESRNQIGQYAGAGLSYTGLIPNRDEDVLSFGVAHARNSDEYRNATEGALRAETALELNYRGVITPYLSVTPDLQWIIDPGTTAGVDDALAIGVRVELSL